jgi:hypothetical protein
MWTYLHEHWFLSRSLIIATSVSNILFSLGQSCFIPRGSHKNIRKDEEDSLNRRNDTYRKEYNFSNKQYNCNVHVPALQKIQIARSATINNVVFLWT